jgi:hypothetical protein
MNRDVKILQTLARHLHPIASPDIRCLAVALLQTAEDLQAEDIQELKDARALDDAYSEACALDSPYNSD